MRWPWGATPIKSIWVRCDIKRGGRCNRLLADTGNYADRIANHQLWNPESFDGNTIDLRVGGDDSGSMLGITLTYGQHDQLLIIAELVDDRWVVTVADIPDARYWQEMRVLLP